jgi:hypothetical protein
LRVTPEHEQLLQAVVRFANLRAIRSTRQVEGLFRQLDAVGPVFQILHPGEENAYRRDQAKLRRWLERIAQLRGQEIASEVSQSLGTIDARVDFAGDLRTIYRVQGVEACCALGAALLLSPSVGLGKAALGRCDAPGCGRFRLNLAPKPGRPWRYCNQLHRQRADAVKAKLRVAKWRQKVS